MKTRRRNCPAALAGVCAFLFTCALSASGEESVAVFMTRPPKVDGDLSDAVWKSARPVQRLTLAGSETPTPKMTSVRAGFDSQALYLGIECAEPEMDRIYAAKRDRDGSVWQDDCIEIFLRPCGYGPGEYDQLVVNSLGSIGDHRVAEEQQGKPQDWNPTWQAAVRRLPQRWQVEVRIPFRAFHAEAALRGDVWGFKLGRHNRMQAGDGTRGPSVRYTWPANTRYGLSTDYGALVFASRNCLRNADFSAAGGRKFGEWHIKKGDDDRFELVTHHGVKALRFRAPEDHCTTIGQSFRIHPHVPYLLQAEAKSNIGIDKLRLRSTNQGEKDSHILANVKIERTERFRPYEVAIPAGPRSDALFLFGNDYPARGENGVTLLRNLRVERVEHLVVPEYMTWERTEPDPVHGLRAFMERHGLKPYERLHTMGLNGCERLVFRDTVTDTEIWKLTNDCVQDGHHYSLWPPYSPNGAHLWLSSPRWMDGKTRAAYCVMGSDGDAIRRLLPRSWRYGWWHPRDGNVYFCFDKSKACDLMALDVRTMEAQRLAKLPPKKGYVYIVEPGPWSEWLLVMYPDKASGQFVRMDGSASRGVEFPGMKLKEVHFSRAHKDVFFSYDEISKATIAFRVTSDGGLDPQFLVPNTMETNEYRNMRRGGHSQSSPDETMYFRPSGVLIRADGSQRQIIDPSYLTAYKSFVGNNGYVSWVVTPEWLLFNNGPQVVKLWSDGSNVHNICFLNTLSTAYNSMPWACSSPDGTKLVYRSMMTDNVELYQAVVSKPLPPGHLRAKATQDGVALTWKAPALHKEIAGYLVYRSTESGRGFRQLTSSPVADTHYADTRVAKGDRFHYVVSSVEHSGLESGYSNQVQAGRTANESWEGPVRHFYEAEFAALEQPVLLRRSPRAASNMHYVSAGEYLAQKQGSRGSVTFEIQAPKSAVYRLLGRARIKRGTPRAAAQLELDGRPLGPWQIASADWQWDVGAPAISLEKGEHRLKWIPDDHTVELDRICITDDDTCTPRGFGLGDDVAPDRVIGLKADSVSTFEIALSWQADRSSDFNHYNVYASRRPGFEPSQATRVASPYKPGFLDWGLKPGTTHAYRVTAVDRAGNEGQASAEVTARTLGQESFVIEIQAETCQVHKDAELTADPDASGGKAVWVPEIGTTGKFPNLKPGKATGALVADFSAPADGTYVVWARLKSTWLKAHLELAVDGEATKAYISWPLRFGYHHKKSYNIWGSADYQSYIYCWCQGRSSRDPAPPPFRYKLAKGQHRLELRNIREGLSVDQLVITNDFSWIPEGVRNYY